MSRLTQPQLIIFLATFLAVSVTGNLLLFSSQSDLTDQQVKNEMEISRLEQTIKDAQQLKSDQISRLDQMNGQQTELGDIINQLQFELTNLQNEYAQTVDTAKQTRDQLATAKLQISTLDTELSTAQNELREAEVTIRNQQRALRESFSQTNKNRPSSSAAELSAVLTPLFNDISVTESAQGVTIISIPLDYIFLSNDLDLSPNVDLILGPIARELKAQAAANAWVIGHADGRPIVSDLSLRYPTNWELSSARASKVVNYLIERGVKAEFLTAAGKASNAPVRDGISEDVNSLNRRLEIQIR